jgi:putative transposase
MPSKNSLKQYGENSLYHIYNRGVNKDDIFLDSNDYSYFLRVLQQLLSPESIGKNFVNRSGDISSEVKCLCFCLMPNHYHLLIYQLVPDGITKLMRRLATSYSMYFNKKYDRVGPLFQGRYKAVRIETNEQALHVSRYIHLNLLDLPSYNLKNMVSYKYSTYRDYLGKKSYPWINKKMLLNQFGANENNQIMSYENFVLSYKTDEIESYRTVL